MAAVVGGPGDPAGAAPDSTASRDLLRKLQLPSGSIDVPICESILTKEVRLILSIDGSEMSMTALAFVTEGVMQHDKATFVEVLHIYDESKDHLPVHCQKVALMATCDAIMTGSVSAHRYQLNWVQRKGAGTTGQQICDAIRTLPADYICMGFYGLKGKKDYTDIMGTKLSTNVFNALHHGNGCSVICIKDEILGLLPLKEKQATFVVSVTLSKSSTKAFLDALRLSKAGDAIHVVYVGRTRSDNYVWEPAADEPRDFAAETRAKYESFISSLQDEAEPIFSRFRDRKLKFVLLSPDQGETLARSVVRYADEVNADFVVVGANASDRVARGKTPVGSVSLQMCFLTSRNFIVANWIDVSLRVYDQTVMSSRDQKA